MKSGYPEEYPILLTVNGSEIAIFQLSKYDLEDWAYGYLFSEGLISTSDDVVQVNVDNENGRIDVELKDDFSFEDHSNKKKHYTSGCGRGVTFFSMTDVKNLKRIESEKKYQLSYLLKKRSEFAQNTPMYFKTGGMHGACLVLPNGELVIREDIGRHNAVDKVLGYAVRNKLDCRALILMTTGRISYEMLSKTAKSGIPVVASRTAATLQAVQLSKFLNVEVVGYLRNKDAQIYNNIGRIENDFL